MIQQIATPNLSDSNVEPLDILFAIWHMDSVLPSEVSVCLVNYLKNPLPGFQPRFDFRNCYLIHGT